MSTIVLINRDSKIEIVSNWMLAKITQTVIFCIALKFQPDGLRNSRAQCYDVFSNTRKKLFTFSKDMCMSSVILCILKIPW